MKILLVRLRLIGDVVLTTPLVRALRARYPDAHLTFAVEPLAEQVVRHNPHINQIVVLPKSRGLRRLRDDASAAAGLRRGRFDVAVDLHGGPRAAWLTWASGAPMRIGYRTGGRTWMYSHPVARPAGNSRRHAVMNQWDLLAPLGIETPPNPDADGTEMHVPRSATDAVERLMASHGIEPGAPLVVLHVTAGNPFRRWPPEHFAALVLQLARRDRTRRFFLVTGPSETDAARSVIDRVRALEPAVATRVHAPFVALDELHALVTRASLYIGSDSGPMHVASTTRTPMVALFGATIPERWMPWRDARWFTETVDAGPLPCRPCQQRTCEPGDFRCLTRIGAEQVAAAAERALAARDMSQRKAAHA